MSPPMPQPATRVPPEDLRTNQVPVEGRKMTLSALPSPSKSDVAKGWPKVWVLCQSPPTCLLFRKAVSVGSVLYRAL